MACLYSGWIVQMVLIIITKCTNLSSWPCRAGTWLHVSTVINHQISPGKKQWRCMYQHTANLQRAAMCVPSRFNKTVTINNLSVPQKNSTDDMIILQVQLHSQCNGHRRILKWNWLDEMWKSVLDDIDMTAGIQMSRYVDYSKRPVHHSLDGQRGLNKGVNK